MAEGMTVTPHAEIVVPQQGSDQVNSLMQMAIEQKVPVELLERLVGLQERITERDARGAFFNSLAVFQDECPEINHSKKVSYVANSGALVKYSYAPLPEIVRVIRPILTRLGFSYSWTNEAAGTVLNVTCVLRHIDGHEERASFPVPMESKAGMSAAQKTGAALTYGRRQSLVSVLGLTTADQDVDGATPADNPEGDEFISDEQLANLSDLIEEAKADKARFLTFLGIEKLSDLRKAGFAGAVKALEERKNAKK